MSISEAASWASIPVYGIFGKPELIDLSEYGEEANYIIVSPAQFTGICDRLDIHQSDRISGMKIVVSHRCSTEFQSKEARLFHSLICIGDRLAYAHEQLLLDIKSDIDGDVIRISKISISQ